ncbi:carboxylating nicotinate-nucleotide diphosphorylase [Botrimarina sp.]|uniref:carboxylating nicotinate-nucleotide diphosphorylase n=1 Tax=Botrimarina sp. TaxID=2795802 RepID=UPI0032EC8A36
MPNDFAPAEWNAALEADLRELVRLALREDLGVAGDITSQAIVAADRRGAADVVSRGAGVLAGVRAVGVVLEVARADAVWAPRSDDAAALAPGERVGRLEGNALDLLRCERLVLNLLSRLCGVATLTRRYADAVAGTGARVYDTRKTTPGWRRLEKYAVRCGGGHTHRSGLDEAVLIKDNHLAQAAEAGLTPAAAVRRARKAAPDRVIEVEVDSLDQLRGVLPEGPDIVLLDNMPPEELCEAVLLREKKAPQVVLEASGGVRLDTIAAIAATGVDRISVGALTHSAVALDLGLDWAASP